MDAAGRGDAEPRKADMRKDLLPGEQVITVTRPQPRKLAFPGLLFIVAPALGAFASAWIVKGEPARLVPLITREWTPLACRSVRRRSCVDTVGVLPAARC